MKRIIVDVRETDEFATSHVAGATSIPLSQIEQDPASVRLPPDSELVLYCRSGNRSERAKRILESQGYKNTVNGINQENVESKFL